MLEAIHAQKDFAVTREKAKSIVDKPQPLRLAKAAELIHNHIDESLNYYRFPTPHWRRIRTNNSLERIRREIRRRTLVVGAIPYGNSALMLVAARLRHIAGTHWGTRRYLKMDLLNEIELEERAA